MKIWMIIFLVLAVSHRVQSQKRLVVNTTCLELAKPSNQQLRLSCRQYDYHCLLDESYTKEFEVCTEWRWIPGGKCAYFNTHGRGNIDQRNCIRKTNLTCSNSTDPDEFSSSTNTNFTGCYVKKEISTSLPSTTSTSLPSTTSTSLPSTTSSTGTQLDGGNATSDSSTRDKQYERSVLALPIIFGIIAPFVSIAVIYFICMHLKYVPLYRKASPVESQESGDRVMNEDNVEQQPLLRIEMEDASKSPTLMRHEDMNDSDLSDHFEDGPSSPTIIAQRNYEVSTDIDEKGDNDELRKKEVDSDTCKSAEDISKNLKEGGTTADVQSKELDEEKSAENASGLCIVSDKSDNEEGDKEEPTDVFDDTVESLQRIAHPTDEQDRELCIELYNLLNNEGLKLTQEVITAIITRETGKSVKILLNSFTDQEKNKLKEMLPEESRHILESITEHETSFHVSYGLHQIFLDEKHHPKSGWGNPVRGTDIGIGDNVERLNKIQTIVQGIAHPVTVSVESYIRLLDIMIGALIRLDPGAEFKEDYKQLSYKLESIKNPHLTQTMYKIFTDIAKKIW